MSYFAVDDEFHSHPKVMQCSNDAIGLWCRAGSWCQKYLTDGYVPASAIEALGGSEASAAALVKSRLWELRPGGYQFHEWDERQGRRDRILARRRADSERKQRVVRADGRADSERIPSGSREDFRSEARRPTPTPTPEEERDPNQPPALPTLTGSTHAHAQNTNGGESAIELGREDDSRAQAAFAWLHGILWDCVQQAAPRVAGKWGVAYRHIGSRPAAEWLHVEACLRSELAARRLNPHACTPGHVADYWAAYAAGEPPGRRKGARQLTAPVAPREVFERGAENNPDWLTEESEA